MVTFSPALPDTASLGDAGHVSDHNSIVAGLNKLNGEKVDYGSFTAKGTLVIGSAANAVGTLTVGTNNQVLIADSAQALGVKWGQLPETGLADSAVTTNKIADSAVTSVKIADGTITGTDIAGLTITAANIANDTITSAQIAADAVGSSEIAAGAVGTSEIAAGAVGTAAIQDAAVTSAKIADGTIATGDISDGAVTVAKLGSDVRIGNLLTLNQASVETDSSPFGAFLNCTISRSTDHAAHGSACLKAIATAEGEVIAGLGVTTVPVTPGETITGTFALKADRNLTDVRITIQWATGGAPGAFVYRLVNATTAWVTHSLTVVVPAGVDTAGLFAWVTSEAPAGSEIYMDCFGIWKGAGGVWALPGTPIVGLSEQASNNAIHLSGTGSPEGAVTAAPGSTWLQTDATTDVKGWIRWIKATGTGNTGWVAGPEADTGWRKILSWTSGTQDGANQIGTIDTAQYSLSGTGDIRVRRIGQEVFWWFHGVVTKINSGPHQLCGAVSVLPSGFRLDGGSTYGVNAPLTHSAELLGGWGIGDQPAVATPAASVDLSLASSSHYCANPWPASLPGVAGT